MGPRIGIADSSLHGRINWKLLDPVGRQSAADDASAILKELYPSQGFAQREAQP
jgi:hypothetical protein